MKKLLTLLLALATAASGLFAQGTVTLGTGTGSNGTSVHPTPYGTYYKNHRVQYLILASELSSLGVVAGDITSLGFNVAAVNNCSPMPNFKIDLKLTDASELTATFDNEGYTTVWTDPAFLPVEGWNTHTFTSPFNWNGTSNLLVDICFDLIEEYTQNASVFFTATPGSNLASYYRSDTQVACGTTNNATISLNRANMQITAMLASCLPPSNLEATNPTTNSVVLSWIPVGTETLWNLKYGEPGFDPEIEGTMVTGIDAIPYTLEGLTPVTTYDFYLQADCGGMLSNWAGPGSFTTTSDPLSGVYTINSTLPTEGDNFNNFSDFAIAINLGGFAGPVTVNVVAGTGPYTERVALGQLPNSSDQNTLTINGNGETLQYLATITELRATLQLDGTDYLTIDNLLIKALGVETSGEFGWAVHLANGADFNTFTNCQFVANITSTSTNYAGFVASNNPTGAAISGVAANNLTIDNCTAIGGYYGIIIQGPTIFSGDDPAVNNTITNNVVKDFRFYGIYVRGQNHAIISGNQLSRPDREEVTTTYAIYLTQDMTGTEVTKNHISEFAGNVQASSTAVGIYTTGIDAAMGEELLIANNIIYGFQGMNSIQRGMAMFTTNNTRVYHNTILLDDVDHTGSSLIQGIYHSGNGLTIDIRNNIISVLSNSTGNKHCLFFTQTAANIPDLVSDHNVFYMGATAGTNNLVRWAGDDFATLADWQLAAEGAYDQNSAEVDPLFINPIGGDLTPSSGIINDMGTDLLAFVPDDFFGIARTTTPDPGAIEFDPPDCPQPAALTATEITATSALLGWTPGGDETKWNIEWGLEGFEQGTGTFIEGVMVNPYLLEGLDPLTSYAFYVQSDCSTKDLSPWVGPLVFTTLPSCPAPTDLAANDITANSALLEWVAGGEESMWNVLWGEAGFDPLTQGTLVEGLMVESYELAGLTQNTAYDFYVQANCGDELSTWAGPATFTTLCDAFALPFVENFDGSSVDCWMLEGNWGIGESYTPPSSLSGAPNAFFNWSPSQTDYSFSLTSPLLDATFMTDVTMDYILFLNSYSSSTVESMAVEYKTLDAAEWMLLEQFSNDELGSGNEEFIRVDQPLAGVDGSMFQVRFRAHGANSFNLNGWGLDDILITGEEAVTYTVTFIVQDEDLLPIADAVVTLGDVTNDPGDYTFEYITPGMYAWTVTAFGYLPAEGMLEVIDQDVTVAVSMIIDVPGALSGNYTINSTMPTGGTNFNSFTDFADVANEFGLAGTVVVGVVAGTGPYNEQVMLNELAGSSEVNTLTINGNGETLEFLSTDSNARHTFALNGTNYVHVDNLIFEALGADGTSAWGWAVWLSNEADYNTFTNCHFIANMTETQTNYAGFVASNSATGATSAGLAASNLTIDNCVTMGGYYGITLQGPTEASGDPNAQNNLITNCEIKDFRLYGIYLRGQNNALIAGNDISRPEREEVSTAYGIYFRDNMTGTEIVNNRIHTFAGNAYATSAAYGIYGTTNTSNIGEELLIANNLIYGFDNMNGIQRGIALFTSDNVRVYHNTISVDNINHAGSNAIQGIYHSGNGFTIDIRNNIISVTSNSTGTKHCLYFAQTDVNVPLLTSDHNVLHMGATAGTNHLVYWRGDGGTDYTTLEDWQLAGSAAYDQNSVETDPLFTSPVLGDLTPQNPLIDNIGTDLLAFVPEDFFGVLRTVTPDPGAIEFDPPDCTPPSNLSAENITTTSADLGWIPTGDETVWNLEWGLEGFEQGTGTLIQGITNIPYALEGLDHTTSYAFFVQAVCGDNLSSWAGPLVFTTACDVFGLPFSEGFDGASVTCWDLEGNWGIGTSWAPPSSVSGTPHAFFNWSPSQTDYSLSLTSPVFDASSNEAVAIDYILFINSFNATTIEYMSVEFKTVDATEWTLLEQFSSEGLGSANEEYIRVEQELAGIGGNLFQIRFRAHGANTYNINGWAMDDLHLYEYEIVILPGDANCDGEVNIMDIITIAEYIMDNNPEPFCFENADINGDGVINLSDLIATVNIVMGGDVKSLFTGLNSATANIYLNRDGILLQSDGTLSGLQFELTGLDASQLELMIPGYTFMTNMVDSKLVCLIFSMDNTPIPAGNAELFRIADQAEGAAWGNVAAVNTAANEVKIISHILLDSELSLSAYPNPSNGNITALLSLPENSQTMIRIVDVMGREVHRLHDGNLAAGSHTFNADLSKQVSKGIYFLQMEAVAETSSTMISRQLKLIVIE
jgi:hypothetical protein